MGSCFIFGKAAAFYSLTLVVGMRYNENGKAYKNA